MAKGENKDRRTTTRITTKGPNSSQDSWDAGIDVHTQREEMASNRSREGVSCYAGIYEIYSHIIGEV